MKLTYKSTFVASSIGYICQALVINFAPLLFYTFQNVYIHDIISDNCNNIIEIKTAPGRGNIIENIVAENTKGNKAICGVKISSKAFLKGDEELTHMPTIRNVLYKNIEVDTVWHGLLLQGYPEYPLQNIHLENISVGALETTTVIEHIDGMHFNNVEVHYDKENWFDWQTHGYRGKQ